MGMMTKAGRPRPASIAMSAVFSLAAFAGCSKTPSLGTVNVAGTLVAVRSCRAAAVDNPAETDVSLTLANTMELGIRWSGVDERDAPVSDPAQSLLEINPVLGGDHIRSLRCDRGAELSLVEAGGKLNVTVRASCEGDFRVAMDLHLRCARER